MIRLHEEKFTQLGQEKSVPCPHKGLQRSGFCPQKNMTGIKGNIILSVIQGTGDSTGLNPIPYPAGIILPISLENKQEAFGLPAKGVDNIHISEPAVMEPGRAG